MTMDKRVLRIGAAVILCAVLLRLLGSSLPGGIVKALSQPEVAAVIVFLQTGRVVRAHTPIAQVTPQTTEPTTVETLPVSRPKALTLSSQAAQTVQLRNSTGYEPDITRLLTQSLSWELTADAPTVLILHTHGTEAYRECDGYRSEQTTENLISIGDHLAQLLEAAGIHCVHDRFPHDQPSYNGSYSHARSSIEDYLEKYPSIRLVLDLHRDAAETESGQQINYTVQTPQGEAAQLMLVVGTDAGGLNHPHWQENLALAVKLQAVLEQLQPGSCRPIDLRSSRFNQDLTPGAMLIEVGAAGNSHQEALLAAQVLARGIIALAHGVNG